VPRTLGLVDLELELLCDEARNALHHPLTRAFAANVNIAVVRVADKADVRSAPAPKGSERQLSLVSSGESISYPCIFFSRI